MQYTVSAAVQVRRWPYRCGCRPAPVMGADWAERGDVQAAVLAGRGRTVAAGAFRDANIRCIYVRSLCLLCCVLPVLLSHSSCGRRGVMGATPGTSQICGHCQEELLPEGILCLRPARLVGSLFQYKRPLSLSCLKSALATISQPPTADSCSAWRDTRCLPEGRVWAIFWPRASPLPGTRKKAPPVHWTALSVTISQCHVLLGAGSRWGHKRDRCGVLRGT